MAIKIKDQNQEMENEIAMLKQQVLGQYSRRNCLVFYGINNSTKERMDELVNEFVHTNLNFKLYDNDLDRSHRLMPKNEVRQKNNAYPITVKFSSHDIKQLVCDRKKQLKGKNFFITKSLTSIPLQCILRPKKTETI